MTYAVHSSLPLAQVAALAALVVLLGLLAAALLRNRPEEKGLRPIAASADDPAPRLRISSSLDWKRV